MPTPDTLHREKEAGSSVLWSSSRKAERCLTTSASNWTCKDLLGATVDVVAPNSLRYVREPVLAEARLL
jgi:hypothetical protein